VFPTSGTYPWSFVTQLFCNGQPSHGGDRKTFEVMTSLLAATLYQGNPNRTTSSGISYQLRDIYSICRCFWNVATYGKCTMGKLESSHFFDLIRLNLTTVEISLYLYSQRLLDISFLSVPDNGYFRGELCALNYIYLRYY